MDEARGAAGLIDQRWLQQTPLFSSFPDGRGGIVGNWFIVKTPHTDRLSACQRSRTLPVGTRLQIAPLCFATTADGVISPH